VERQDINIPPIHLGWSAWFSWNELMEDVRSGGIRIPNGKPGVYEVKPKHNLKRLTIGKASDLRMRTGQGLIKGKTQHSAGKRIRANEDTNNIEIRWAETDRPSAAEEELHEQYLTRFGKWPKYTDHT